MRAVALFLILICPLAARAEDPAYAEQAQQPQQLRSLVVLPSTDTSSFNLGSPMQYALSSLFQQTQGYNVQMGSHVMTGFTEKEVAAAFQITQAEIMCFTYLEAERVSIFLFDSVRPREFVVAAETLADPMLGNEITPQVIEYKFRLAFDQMLNQYYQAQFQPLPGSQQDTVVAQAQLDDPTRRAEESRRLFRELASLQDGNVYIGGRMGMARYGGGGGSASAVDFGVFVGTRLNERFRGELGVEFFSYAMLHIDGRYRIPFAEKYLTLSASAGAGMILGPVTNSLSGNTATLNSGALMFGPGVTVEVPLLGATVRGEVKFLFGDGSVLMGTYGITYTL